MVRKSSYLLFLRIRIITPTFIIAAPNFQVNGGEKTLRLDPCSIFVLSLGTDFCKLIQTGRKG